MRKACDFVQRSYNPHEDRWMVPSGPVPRPRETWDYVRDMATFMAAATLIALAGVLLLWDFLML